MEVLYPGCRQEVVDGLAECDFGDWDGRSVAELQSDPLFLRWMAGDSGVKIPDGENADAFQKRVMAAFEELVQELMRSGDTEAVVCTHGGVIMLLMMAYALPKLEMSDCVAESGNGFTLRITPSVWMREPVALSLIHISRPAAFRLSGELPAFFPEYLLNFLRHMYLSFPSVSLVHLMVGI